FAGVGRSLSSRPFSLILRRADVRSGSTSRREYLEPDGGGRRRGDDRLHAAGVALAPGQLALAIGERAPAIRERPPRSPPVRLPQRGLGLARGHVLAGRGSGRHLLVAGDEAVDLLREVALVGDDLVLALAERLLLVVDRAQIASARGQLLFLGLEGGAFGRDLLACADELVAPRQDVAPLLLELFDAARHLG